MTEVALRLMPQRVGSGVACCWEIEVGAVTNALDAARSRMINNQNQIMMMTSRRITTPTATKTGTRFLGMAGGRGALVEGLVNRREVNPLPLRPLLATISASSSRPVPDPSGLDP